MKIHSLMTICTRLAAVWVVSASSVSRAATFIIDFPTTANAHLDPFYNQLDAQGNFISGDQHSYIYDGVARTGNVTADLSGRYYDSDPEKLGTYGLRDNEDVPDAGWVVRFGLAPDSVGSLIHTYHPGQPDELKVPASYLNFHIHSPEQVVFDSVTLVIKDIVGVGPTTVWAATSGTGFTDAIVGTEVFDDETGRIMTWTWSNLNLQTTGMDIHIYGVQGADEGTFGTGILTGTFDPPPVPEASTSLLACSAAMMLMTMRKRRKI